MNFEERLENTQYKKLLKRSLVEIENIDNLIDLAVALNLSEKLINKIDVDGDMYGRSPQITKKHILYMWITNDEEASMIKLAKAITTLGMCYYFN